MKAKYVYSSHSLVSLIMANRGSDHIWDGESFKSHKPLNTMHISWLGSTTFKIQTKPLSDDVMVLLDPYKPAHGEFPRSLAADIVIGTQGNNNLVQISGSPFVLSSPGECETKGVLMTATSSQTPGQTVVRLDSEQLSIGFLGNASKPLNDQEMEVVTGVDILFVPVGGENSYDAETAVKMVNGIEPRIVIPMGQRSENNPNAADVSAFVKAIGLKADEPQTKVILKKKDLPQDEMRVILFEKE